jgi:hypothetical protein
MLVNLLARLIVSLLLTARVKNLKVKEFKPICSILTQFLQVIVFATLFKKSYFIQKGRNFQRQTAF